MPSKDYDAALVQMRQFHRTSKAFSGNGVLKHRDSLVQFSRARGATSGLDFGCGKGNQYNIEMTGGYNLAAELGYTPYKYDPGVPDFDVLPPLGMVFDIVWCVDVLECVPEQDMDWEVANIAAFARRGLFVTVGSYPSKKTLPNGRNAHITIQDEEWWHAKFQPLWEARPDLKIILLVG